jgi:hypothetical protein
MAIKIGKRGSPPKIVVKGKNDEETVDKMNPSCLRGLWGDGLPINLPQSDGLPGYCRD